MSHHTGLQLSCCLLGLRTGRLSGPDPVDRVPAYAVTARRGREMFRQGVQVFGADRILFSTDYPYGDPVEHARFLAQAPISPADRDKIAYRNAQHLFRL